MSDADAPKRGRKPSGSNPGSRPGGAAGRSGTAKSIGAELGGLDFEPDALLDSLFDEGPPAARPPLPPVPLKPASADAPLSQPGPKLIEPERRLYPADEVTLVGESVSDDEPPSPKTPGPARARTPEPANRRVPEPAVGGASDIDALLAESEAASSPASAPKARAFPVPEPPRVPHIAPASQRLGGASAKPSPPRPTTNVPRPGAVRALGAAERTAQPPAVNPAGPPPREPFPPAMSPHLPSLGTSAPRPPAPPSIGDTLADVEPSEAFDQFDEDVVDSRMPTSPFIDGSDVTSIVDDDWDAPSAADSERSEGFANDSLASLDDGEFEEISSASASEMPTKKPAPRSATPRPESVGDSWEDERPAAAHLAEQDAREAWMARAEWLESEAHSLNDPQAKARTLVVAAELWAMVGDVSRAREVATEAGVVAPAMPLVQRELRWLAAAEADWNAVVLSLEPESKASPTPEARLHAAYLSAEVNRLKLRDDAAAQRKLDVAIRTLPSDPRAHVHRLAQLLAKSPQAPRQRWPDATELAELVRAADDLVQLRGGAVPGGPAERLDAVAFEATRRALQIGDRAAAGATSGELQHVAGLERGALWLSAALLAHDAETRPRSIAMLTELLAQSDTRLARRALAARALEQGDAEAVLEALASGRTLEEGDDAPIDPFGAEDRLALGALTGGDAAAMRPWLEAMLEDPTRKPLAAAALATTGAGGDPLAVALGDDRSRTAVALGRALALFAQSSDDSSATDARAAELRARTDDFAIAHPEHALSRALGLEIAVEERAAGRVATALAEWPRADEEREGDRDRRLAAALVLEMSGERALAQREYAAALGADPACEVAARALLADAPPDGAGQLLSALAEVCADNGQAALLFIEAALRRGFEDPEKFDVLLKRAADAQPGLPLAYRLGEQLARMRGDAEALLTWLRMRRDATSDPIDRALDLVREALLVADNDLGLAATLLEEAVRARPADLALRELHERVTAGANTERGRWREAVAAESEESVRPRLLIEAALEYERADELENAARTASAAAEQGNSELGRVIAERTGAAGAYGARLAEQLLGQARDEADPVVQRELYERLSVIDAARGDASSSLLWQTAIMERTPDYLPALRRLEHAYIGAGRDEELEPIAAALARALDTNEAGAHALLAARLRARSGSWSAAREMVELAARGEQASLWALRALSSHARASNDDVTSLEIEKRLSHASTRPLDGAALALRAAEAAARLGRLEDARALLDRAVELVPDHLVALTTRAEILEALGDHAAAAAAHEAAAAASSVDAHRLSAYYQAAILWLEKAGDQERGQIALEHASAIDIAHEDVFARLQAVYVARNERAKLAALLEQRLAKTSDPEERVALEVTRGRALAEVGDREAAKRALAAALERSPDHAEALDAFAEVCRAEGDWEGAEQAWIRLARHANDPERQAQVYRKLGALYDQDLPNPQRAELAYKEVLKRQPNDSAALERLVYVYGKLGDIPKAIELMTDLVNRAASPEEKRDRTLELARVYETVGSDRRKAEATLDKARKAWGQDGVVLRALAELHQRHGEGTAVNVLLDRAASDARRALATGRFDPSFFEMLGTVAELRGGADAAAVAKSTLAALEGRDEPVRGAGTAGADARLDELIAPELLSSPLRVLLKKSGDALDAAYPMDLRSLRAVPLPTESADFVAHLRQLASGFGLQGLEIFTSPALGPVCMPVSSTPAQIVFGQVLLDSSDEAARYFLTFRALKILQGRAAALSRTAPIELWPVTAAFLGLFASNWQPQGIDMRRFAEAQQRIRAALPRHLDDDVPVLALEVIGSLGNRASQLATAVHEWGNRAGLLAIGDAAASIRGIALAGGHTQGPPSDGAERMKWIVRNPEARDLAIFSVSEQYTEARHRLGLAG